MKKIALICLIVTILISYNAFANENIVVWQQFAKAPNTDNLNQCLKTIFLTTSQKGDSQILQLQEALLESEALPQILELVESGNMNATELVFALFPVLKGYPDVIGYFYVTIGKVVNTNPNLLLQLLIKYRYINNIEVINLDSLLLKLGDDYVDEYKKSNQEILNRMNSLKTVSDKDLKNIKEECLTILANREKLYKEILKEYK
jgi:hypothetical protein